MCDINQYKDMNTEELTEEIIRLNDEIDILNIEVDKLKNTNKNILDMSINNCEMIQKIQQFDQDCSTKMKKKTDKILCIVYGLLFLTFIIISGMLLLHIQ